MHTLNRQSSFATWLLRHSFSRSLHFSHFLPFPDWLRTFASLIFFFYVTVILYLCVRRAVKNFRFNRFSFRATLVLYEIPNIWSWIYLNDLLLLLGKVILRVLGLVGECHVRVILLAGSQLLPRYSAAADIKCITQMFFALFLFFGWYKKRIDV